MTDLVIALILLAVVGGAIGYIIRQKRQGIQCIGCPDAKTCKNKSNGTCNCK